MIEKYKPLFIHLNPASIPEVVAHIQKYLIEHEFVTIDDFGTQFQEYIDAHPDIIKVGSVNGLTGDVVLTSENITMTGESSDTIGAVIGDILEDASATGETVDDLVIDMGTAKTNITNLTSDVAALENVFVGATEESSGVKGLVPAPANTQTSNYLKATGDFEAIPAREVVSAAISGQETVESALSYLDSRFPTGNMSATSTVELQAPFNSGWNTLRTVTLPSEGNLYLVKGYIKVNSSGETRVVYGFPLEQIDAVTKYSLMGFTLWNVIPAGGSIDFRLYISNPSVITSIICSYEYIRLS